MGEQILKVSRKERRRESRNNTGRITLFLPSFPLSFLPSDDTRRQHVQEA
jgi:hypothetical protein